MCLASVSDAGRQDVTLDVIEKRVLKPPLRRVTLAAAVPKHAKFEQIIDQTTQMGVYRIIPLLTERGVVKVRSEDRAGKLSRWRQVACEAAKQSEVGRLPLIDPAIPFQELVASFPSYDALLLAAVEAPHRPLKDLLGPSSKDILIMIGPEGDFTPEEISCARSAGAAGFSLGPNVLRCETAAVASVAFVSCLLDHDSL